MGNGYRKKIVGVLAGLALLCLCTAGSGELAAASENGNVTGRVPEYSVSESYAAYLSAHGAAKSGSGAVTLKGADYAGTEGMDVTVDGDMVLTGTEGSISWEINAREAGFYQIDIEYAAVPDGGKEIWFDLLLNGEVPFAQASPLVFYRMYTDESRDYKEMEGNQSFPSQIEVSDYQTVPLSDSEGYYGEGNGLKFYFKKGSNTLTLKAVKDRMMIKSLSVRPAEELYGYEDYLSQKLDQGAAYMEKVKLRVQGEDAAYKSSPSLYPQNDRTSALTEPYDPTYIVLNTIGGGAWKKAGEWLEWQVDAPQSGLYRIAVRYKQKDSPGFAAVRAVTINGNVPFAEALNLKFDYSTSFQVQYLQSESREPLYFYLEEGTNTIRLSCALGNYAEAASKLQEEIDELSRIYYSITAITSTSPTLYQDYQLTKRLPNVTVDLKQAGEQLGIVRDMVTGITGGTTDVSGALDRASAMLLDISEHPGKITGKVTAIADVITSLGASVLTLSQQALTIDWLELQGEKDTLPRAEGTLLQKVKHEFFSFVGSFTNDYNVAKDRENETQARQSITVWVSTGRDQMDVLRRLINESFTSDTGIAVDLKLVDASIIMTAVAGGTGPDVAIGVSNVLPMELGYRGAAYDLARFEDFEKVKSQFSPAAVGCFEFEGSCYALPDQMSFPVMFYRTDILSQYGIMVPETWDELISVIPSLATYNMQVYLDRDSLLTLGAAQGVGTSKAVNSVYLSMLYQNGAELYNEKGSASLLLDGESVACFRKWCDFYNKYGFSPTIDFVTRFRLGSVPIAIMDISYYNRLSISAPEISGKWGVAMVPGTIQEDGGTDHSIPVTVSAATMIKSTVERAHTEDAAWEFLKWWVSSEVQTGYAGEMESVLGSSGRYMVSNLESFEQASWPAGISGVLNDSLGWLREVRQIPGSYLTGRNMENAFYAVISDTSLDPLDTLAGYVEALDQEILRKREEYGLETE